MCKFLMQKSNLLLIALFVFSLTYFFSCKKEKVENIDVTNLVQNSANPKSNYVINHDFTKISNVTGLPLNWRTYFEKGYTQDIDYDNLSVQWERNSPGKYFFCQTIKLEKNKFYKVSASCEYNINDYGQGGIYIVGPGKGIILGKEEKAFESGIQKLEFVFNSGNDTSFKLILGFLHGMNGSIRFSNVAVKDYVYNEKPVMTSFGKFLVNKLKLSFNQDEFNNSIVKLKDYVNRVLMCEIDSNNLEKQIRRLKSILDPIEYPYFLNNLNELSTIWNGYCQHASLTMGELLNNEFNVPTRQVYMQFQGTGKHQFLEYWNPFSKNWVVIDPYYSCQYTKDNKLLGADQIMLTDLMNDMRTVGIYYYSKDLNELAGLWNSMDELLISSSLYVSYPFATDTIVVRPPNLKVINSYDNITLPE